MVCVLFPAGSCLGVVGGRAGGGQPASRRPAASSRWAMLPSMTSSPTRTTRPPRTLGSTVDLQPDRPAVDPAEDARSSRCSCGVGQRDGAWSRGRPTGRAGGWPASEQPLDGGLGVPDVRAGQHVAQQLLGDRADLAAEQPVEQRGLALAPGPCGR